MTESVRQVQNESMSTFSDLFHMSGHAQNIITSAVKHEKISRNK